MRERTAKLSSPRLRRKCRFQIERMFTLAAPSGAQRGQHAHRQCSQFRICVSGAVNVTCEDGGKQKSSYSIAAISLSWCR
jgi:dTDP-4-dehydrorhamnose 3,5-epimerase-like enzyme